MASFSAIIVFLDLTKYFGWKVIFLFLPVLVLPLVCKCVWSELRKYCILFSTRITEDSLVKTYNPSNVLNTCQQVSKRCRRESAITSWVIGTRKRTRCRGIQQRTDLSPLLQSSNGLICYSWHCSSPHDRGGTVSSTPFLAQGP